MPNCSGRCCQPLQPTWHVAASFRWRVLFASLKPPHVMLHVGPLHRCAPKHLPGCTVQYGTSWHTAVLLRLAASKASCHCAQPVCVWQQHMPHRKACCNCHYSTRGQSDAMLTQPTLAPAIRLNQHQEGSSATIAITVRSPRMHGSMHNWFGAGLQHSAWSAQVQRLGGDVAAYGRFVISVSVIAVKYICTPMPCMLLPAACNGM